MGIANILFCCDFFERYARKQLLKRSGVAALVCATSWLVINLILFRPYADAPRMEIATAVTNAAILGLLIWEKRRTWFFYVFAIVMFSNGVWVNPVMTGLSPILDSELYKKVDQIHRADSAARWVVYEEMRLPQLLKATGASVLTGVRILP